MILVDLNQVMIASLMQQINHNPKMELNEDLIRHMILNSLRVQIKQFKLKYGEVVLCCDAETYWRKEYFPFYKANRKAMRDASKYNWPLIFDSLNKIKQELKDYSIYKVLEVEGAEADDLIAVLAVKYASNTPILILSSDKDFMQLQKFGNITQYSPILKRFISVDNPIAFLKEHIICGDRSDGIPNFLSPDNTFISGARQKVLSKKKLAEFMKNNPESFCVDDTMKSRWQRNEKLIDLMKMPENIQVNILGKFDNLKGNSRHKMYTYFVQYGLANLLDVLDEF